MKAETLAARAFAGCLLVLTGSLAMGVSPAAAAVITSLPNGVKQDFPVRNSSVSNPVIFGDGVTYEALSLSGTQTTSVFGYTGSYTFPDGTNWGGGEPFAAVGLQTAIMRFSFDDPVSAVLADFIWARDFTTGFQFRAYNVGGALIESLSFVTADPAYPKGYYGFQRASNDIARFEIEGYYFGARDLSTFTSATGAVPEPATWAMMITGFGLAGAAMRRRRSLSVA